MSITDAPWATTITEQAAAIKSGELSPVTLLDSFLERIDRFDQDVAAFVHLNDQARTIAESAHAEIRAGRCKGPLHGIPIAIKDNYTTSDMPTNAGSHTGVDYPRVDATTVKALRNAGAVLFGKTRMHEFAWGMETPPTRNPRAKDHVPGGSSGGSGAAVAAGLASAALGSDTGGSIRIPASMCGCVGFKPTFGLIVAWVNQERETARLHLLLITALCVVVFLEIHTFQDGNGRLSRVLTTLLLLQARYAYVPYSSLEVEFTREHGRVTIGEAIKLTGASRNTLKQHFRVLVERGTLDQHGRGRGVWYGLR